LLVPSISSKGFPVDDEGLSETAQVLRLVAPDLGHSLLVSAYDAHYRHLPDVDDLLGKDHASSLYGIPTLLVVDSGGYELSADFEAGEVSRGPRTAKEFSRDDHRGVLAALPHDREILAVTFDDQRVQQPTLDEQLAFGRELAADFPHLQIDILVKPAGRAKTIDTAKVLAIADDLRRFAVVGFTEKELGRTVIEKLVTLATIRRGFDQAGVRTPIHVFGGLDPVMTTLYFMCGAEIFDGLSWLRYAFHEDLAIHEAERAVLVGDIESKEHSLTAQRHVSNILYLQKLQGRLERWAAEPADFAILGPYADRFRETFELVQARLGEGGGR
jgi:hypothetical protein